MKFCALVIATCVASSKVRAGRIRDPSLGDKVAGDIEGRRLAPPTDEEMAEKLSNSPMLSGVISGGGGVVEVGFVCPEIDCNPQQASPLSPLCDNTCTMVDGSGEDDENCAESSSGYTIGVGSCNGAWEAYACENLNDAGGDDDGVGSIGCFSCIGEAPCENFWNNVTIGDASCHGYSSCYKTGPNTVVWSASCHGEKACQECENCIIGSFSCINPSYVSKGSCQGRTQYPGIKYGIDLTVGDRSCIGEAACWSAVNVTVGSDSCIGEDSCKELTDVVIGDGSCIGEASCNCATSGTVIGDSVASVCG